MVVRFRLLGDVEAEVDGHVVDLGHLRQRCVLAALLLDANRAVPPERLLDRVWGEDLPQRARGTLRSYLSRLRQVLAPAAGVGIVRCPSGYVFTVDPATVDLYRFRRLTAQARATDDDEAAAELFEQALGLWRGEAFGSLDTPWLNAVREALAAERLAAGSDRNDIALRLGRHAELLGDLSAAAATDCWNERLAAQLMLALYRCGQQAGALQLYEQMRRRLAEELGTDPSPPLRQLHRQILSADPALTPPANAASAPAGGVGNGRTPVPRQLPAAPSSFVGRATELAELDAITAARSDAAATVVISAIGGIGGIGKTWLALRWAHDNVDRFPDGQLYVNLRGFDPAAPPVPPAVAMRGFLDALGVEPARIPADPDAQAGLYRSLVAGKQMLIVLDNARDTSTVVPLLPGTATCAVLVTSRHQLAGLVSAHGARPLALDVLPEAEARELLTEHLGADRAVSEPQAVTGLLRHCAGLPLALGITATRAALQPGLPLAALAAEIETATGRLDAFDAGELAANLRAVLASSIQALPAVAAKAFVLLGLAPGPDIGLCAVASLTGEPIARVRLLMRRLVTAYLVQEHVSGRYRMHDLVRLHAIELAGADGSARDLAVHRILDHYLHTAHAAGLLLYPHREPITLAPAIDGVQPQHLADYDQALAWLDGEYPALLAAVSQAAATAFDSHAWQLAWTLSHFLNQRGYWHHQDATQLVALHAALRADDGLGQARIHAALGRACGVQGHYRDAVKHLCRVVRLSGELGDHVGQAFGHLDLVRVLERQGRYRPALRHAKQALDLYRRIGDRSGQAGALNAVGWLHTKLGEHRQALAYCQQALAIQQEIGSRGGQANAWDSVGYAHHHLGNHPQAIMCYQRALDCIRHLQNPYMEADVLTHLGDSHHAEGNQQAAHQAWRSAQAILDELGHPDADAVRARLCSP